MPDKTSHLSNDENLQLAPKSSVVRRSSDGGGGGMWQKLNRSGNHLKHHCITRLEAPTGKTVFSSRLIFS